MTVPGSANPLLIRSAAPAGYQIQRSLRFNSSDSAFLSRTPASAGNRKTWTWAGWVKRSGGNEPGIFSSWAGSNPSTTLYFNVDNRLVFYDYNSVYRINLLTTQVFRDFSAWYHIVVAVNTTTATSTDRVKIYANGVQITAFDTATYPALDWETNWNSVKEHNIGKHVNYQEGYLADVHFIDGQALTPSSFTEVSATTGQLIPKAYTDVLPGPVTLVPSIAEGALIIKADAATITGSVTAAGFVKVHSSSDGINWTYREQILSGALSFSAKYIAIGGGSTNSRTFNPSTGGSYTWAEYSAGTQFDTTSNITQNVTGLSYTANSTVTAPFGTNGFWLKFSDNSAATATTLGKDYSGNNNNWTPNNLSVNTGSVASPVRFTWNTAGSGWTLSNSNYTATSSLSNTYSRVTTAALDGSTTYRFVLRQSPADGVGGWFFADTTSVSNTHPDELGGNSLGMRVAESTIGTYGTFATANGTSSGQDQITGLSSISASNGNTTYSEWVVNMTVRKVWVRNFGDSTWLKGGDPSNTSSTPTFSLPSGTIHFGYVGYNGSGTVSLDTSVPSIAAGNDSLVDTPTSYGTSTGIGGEQRGNYAVLNPLDKNPDAALANGNLDYTPGGSVWRPVRATIGVTSGKWYWEVSISNIGILGIATQSTPLGNDYYPGIDATSYGYTYVGTKYNNGSSTSYGSSYTTGDLIGVAYDADNGKVWFSKNGTWQASGDPAAGTNAAYTGINTALTYFPMIAFSGTGTSVFNAGQRAFAYTAPSGFKALVDTNLTAPVIAKPNTVMDVKLYTGNGSTQTISGLGFSPDFVWLKMRSTAGYSHKLVDTVRGATISLVTNNTNAELTEASGLTAFTSDGFSLGSQEPYNRNSDTFVAWAFDAGTTTTTNTAGSITSSCRTNQSSGFSIVGWTGNGAAASIGHGLNVEPHLVIHKFRGGSSNWSVYTKATGTGGRLKLNTTESFSSDGAFPTTPTSSLFYVNAGSNDNGVTMIAYCFAPVAGYSSFGSYTGNGSADGPFVYTGFRPRWVMYKSATNVSSPWVLLDTQRSTYNVNQTYLYANASDQELDNFVFIDHLSNGFKLRSTSAIWNTSGATYIYAAFAESPFQYARAR